jgi:HTH-type transcriptional regulator / antitoxin HigA
MPKRQYRTLENITVEYFMERPEEIDDYLTEIFADYAEDGDDAVLLSQLRVIAQVKGISNIAKEIGISRNGLQKALSDTGNPRLKNLSAIMRAMGYKLTPQRLHAGPNA